MSMKLSTYNNEALASVCLGYYSSLVTEVSIAKVMIVLPFILHEQTARRLRGNSNKRSLDEFIIGNTDCLINFNKRFIDFLPVSVNAVIMLGEMDIVIISSKTIIFNRDKTKFNPHQAMNLGKRARTLLSSIESLEPILSYEKDWSAYLKLKIIL
jgi:hypothetical protein